MFVMSLHGDHRKYLSSKSMITSEINNRVKEVCCHINYI